MAMLGRAGYLAGMGLASPAQPLAGTDPYTFAFARRTSIKAQVRFYADLAASVGNELAASAGGTRSLTVQIQSSVADAALAYSQPVLVSEVVNGTQVVDGATWYEFDLADGAGTAIATATGGSDPGAPTALSYRIILDTEANG